MSKKQDCTAMSSTEAEYVALSASCAQVKWMRTQLQDYGFDYNKIPLYCDSQSAIGISCNPVQHSRTKHIHTRYHFIKDLGIIELYFVRTEYQLTDMFTKALSEDRFQYLVRRIGYRALSVLAYQHRFSAYLAVNLVLRVMPLVLLNLFRTRLIKANQTLLNSNIFPHEEMSIRVLLAKERILKLIQAWDEKQIKPWSLPELLLQLSNDSRTIAEILKQREEKRIEREQAANLARSSKAITPDLPTEEPDNSLSMGDGHLNTILQIESDEVIKSSVKNLVPIISESEVTSDNMCDVPFCDKNHFDAKSDLMESLINQETSIVYSPKIDSLLEEFAGKLAPIPPGIHEADFDLEEDIRLDDQLFYDDTSSDDDSFEDIDYVEASPPDSKLVSLEEVKDFDIEDGEIDTDIFLTIKDDILHEKLQNINLLIAKIESLNDNPISDFVFKSPSSFHISVKDSDFFLEKIETFLSLPKLDTFRFDIEEKNSGSTTVHAYISLPKYDSFYFEIEPDQGELTRVVVEDISDNLIRELYVHVPNVLPTLPTLVDRLYLFLTYDCPDFEESRAHGFVHRPLDLQSFACLY
ncbi:hypothetical protein Tco_0798145 [Tanacetum coccineum]